MMLYKYRSLSPNINPEHKSGKSPKAYTLDLLKHNEFYFSSPDQFNDPFDCHLPAVIIKGRKVWEQYAEHMHNNFGYKNTKIKQTILDAGKLYQYDSTQKPKKNIPIDIKNFMDTVLKEEQAGAFKIFSLTSKQNHPLMWAHYANAYNGVCLGFHSHIDMKTAKKNNFLLADTICYENPKFADYQKRQLMCWPVDYPQENKLPQAPLIMKYRLEKNKQYGQNLITLLTTKQKDWEYEEEYRLIADMNNFNFNKNTPLKIKFNKDILKEVIFGLDCLPEDKEEIKEIVKPKYKQAKFFKCVKKKDEYGVDIVPDE